MPNKHNESELKAMADRELGALAARVVMGWKLSDDKLDWLNFDGSVNRYTRGWEPSTSIADAFVLVEKMRERGIRVVLTEHDDGWYCAFSHKRWIPCLDICGELSNPEGQVFVRGVDSPARAITIAAILAAESEQP